MRKLRTALLYGQTANGVFAWHRKEALFLGAARACGRHARIELRFSRFEKRYRTDSVRAGGFWRKTEVEPKFFRATPPPSKHAVRMAGAGFGREIRRFGARAYHRWMAGVNPAMTKWRECGKASALQNTPPRIHRLVAQHLLDRKSTRLNSSHYGTSRMPSSA